MKRFTSLVVGACTFFASASALAEEHVITTGDGNVFGFKSALAIGAGLAIGLASFGGALGQGKTASVALEGIARNPEATSKVMTPMIIALALIESLVIYALVIAFLLYGKI